LYLFFALHEADTAISVYWHRAKSIYYISLFDCLIVSQAYF